MTVPTDMSSRKDAPFHRTAQRSGTIVAIPIFAGSETVYSLDVKGDEVIVEYLDPGKSTVLHGHKSAQISLPGDIDQISKALGINC